MSGILILTLVAVIVRELLADAGRRQWLLVALAPPLGFALNVVRVAYIAASPDPEALAGPEGDHTAQGLVVLMAGTVILYVLGLAMARKPAADPAPVSDPPEATSHSAPWAIAASVLAVLTVLGWALPGFGTDQSSLRRPIDFPDAGSGWTSQRTESDPLFTGGLSRSIHRRYVLGEASRSPQFVELFVVYEVPRDPNSTRLLSSKLTLPGPEWDLERERRERVWALSRDAELAFASRGTDHAVVYAWRLRDEGLWRESWRSLLGLEASPLRREGRRVAVRLVAYAPHDGQLVLDQAKQRLDRFIAAFREELLAL
jgi:exosortase/archaeosortase family protein